MGKRTNEGRKFMETMELISGADAIMDIILEHVATDNMDLKQIAEEQWGIIVTPVWEWLRAVPPREKAYRHALKYRADRLVHESLDDVNNATMANVPLAALQANHKLKMAEKWDRENYGKEDRTGPAGGVSINVVVQRGVADQTDAGGGGVVIEHSPTVQIPALI